MSVPQPKYAIEGHCSAIDSETLYVYSAAGLQTLPLKENATWAVGPAGKPVDGAACVRAVPNGDTSQAALYVVGGSSEDSSYGGLQRYFFGNKTWETLPLPMPMKANVIQSRTNHSAAYLNDTQSILVYAGSQPNAPSYLSSQTFLISTQPPYNVEGFTSTAPTTNQPILQPWDSSRAVLVGGSPWSTEVNLFDPASGGWQPLGTNISEPLPIGTRGTIVAGSDGSKVLETFDFTTSPNKVTQTVLLGANGATVPNGQTVGSSTSSRKRKRDLTLADWPSYNNTDAPSVTRSDYSVAQDPNNMAVIAGGNTESSISMFDQTGNTWVDAGKYFNGDGQQPLQPSTTSGIDPATTSGTGPANASASATAAGLPGGESAHDRMLRTLGITLGVLCGIAAVFILALLFMRWRKMRRRRSDEYIDEKTGNRMSFADRGASFMKEAGGSVNNLAPPAKDRYGSSANGGSHSSLAIIAGKFNSNKRNTSSHAPKGSYESTTHLVKDKNGNLVVSEPVEMMDIGEKKGLPTLPRKPVPAAQQQPTPTLAVYGASPESDDTALRKRSSGWSKYFATSQPNGLSHLPSAYVKPHSSTDGSEYTDGRGTSQISRIPSSALVPPLDIDFSKTVDGQRLSHVTSGSPAFGNSTEDLARRGSTVAVAAGQKGIIEGGDRPQSQTTTSSYDRSTMSSNLSSDYYNRSGNTLWTPMSNTFKDHVNSRPASSLYTNSVYEQRIPSRGARGASPGFFPGAGTSYKPSSKVKMGHSASPSADWAAPKAPGLQTIQDRDSTVTVFPGSERELKLSVREQPDAQMDWPMPPKAGDLKPAEDRDSTVTVFPRGVTSGYYNRQSENAQPGAERKPANTDMSWLNLGLGSNKA